MICEIHCGFSKQCKAPTHYLSRQTLIAPIESTCLLLQCVHFAIKFDLEIGWHIEQNRIKPSFVRRVSVSVCMCVFPHHQLHFDSATKVAKISKNTTQKNDCTIYNSCENWM